MHPRRAIVVGGAVLLIGASAGDLRAQAPDGQQALPWRYDISGQVGWFHGSARDAVGADEWYHRVLSGGVTLGRYWSPHHRSEIEFGATTADELYFLGHPTGDRFYPFYQSGRLRLSTRTLALAQLYQFGENEWVHPFAGVGVDFDWERRDLEVPPLIDFVNVNGRYEPRLLATGRHEGPDTVLEVRAAVLGGLKAYVSERAFVRADVRLGVARRVEKAVARIGVGVDF
jgi:hypothetical protein